MINLLKEKNHKEDSQPLIIRQGGREKGWEDSSFLNENIIKTGEDLSS